MSLEAGHNRKHNYRGGSDYSSLVEFARSLRRRQTTTEKIFWYFVKNRSFENLKFRRQHQIGMYIADFYCHELRLVVEFDGDVHDNEKQKIYDQERDAYLRSKGNTVLRFQNDDLFDDIENVFMKIAALIKKETIPKRVSPLPLGEAG
jgi:type I restriction enzyme, R subunit